MLQIIHRAQDYKPFDVTDVRNGGPTLSTMLMNIYWKQETKNKTVFSEFSMLGFSKSTTGGLNLQTGLAS